MLSHLLYERKISKREFAAIWGSSSRSTWQREKRKLARLGWKLTGPDKRGYYHVPRDKTLREFNIDPGKRAQVAMLRTAVAALGSPFIEELSPILEAFEGRIALIDPDAKQVAETVRSPEPRADKAFYEKLDRIQTATQEHHMISFEYTPSAGGSTERRWMKPYAVHNHRGRFYIWGYQEGEDYPKFFALDRMGAVSIEESFRANPDVDLGDRLRHSFGIMTGQGPAPPVTRVVVGVGSPAAAYAQAHRWPAEVACERQPGGSLRITFDLEEPHELVAWVLSFGGDAWVIEPEEIAKEVRRRAKAIVARQGERTAADSGQAATKSEADAV